MGDGFVDTLGHRVLGQGVHVTVQRRGADEGVDARISGMADRLPAAINVAYVGAGKAADAGSLRALGNLGDGFEVAFGGDWKTSFDDIDAHVVQHFGDFELFSMCHRCAGGLLAVTQSCVENQHAVLVVCHLINPLVLSCLEWRGSPLSGRADRHAQRRLRSSSARKDSPCGEIRGVCWRVSMVRTIHSGFGLKRGSFEKLHSIMGFCGAAPLACGQFP